MKVAIVHDQITGIRGGEKVLEEMFKIFPDADLYTLVYKKGSTSKIIEERRIYTSFVNKLPFAARLYRQYSPFCPFAIEQFDLSAYDLVLSSSAQVAKGVITNPGTVHIAYIHSPARYYWDKYHEYFAKWPWITKPILGLFATFFRMWDVTSTNRIDYIVANSHFIAQRIWKYYRREADVIYPCVNTERFNDVAPKNQDYYMIVSALVPYKRIDIAVDAFNKNGRKLKIIGKGPELKKLQKMAKANIEFLGWRDDKTVEKMYSHAKGFIMNGVEDFGIAPLEAQAAGIPVIAYSAGGVKETVKESETGIFYQEQSASSLNEAIDRCEKIHWDVNKIKEHSKMFSNERFSQNFKTYIESKLQTH